MTEKHEVELGYLIDGDERRDAIHIAVAPVVAGEEIEPGQHIGLLGNGTAGWSAAEKVGIADPFLSKLIAKGQRFWLLLYPNTITALRHDWFHPAFPNYGDKTKVTKEESEAWLLEFSKTHDCPQYATLLMAATGEHMPNISHEHYPEAYRLDDEYLHFWGRDAHGEIPSEFWDHVENATGKKCLHRPPMFSCSC